MSRIHFMVQIVAQCSETNEKSIFPFLFIESRSILFTILKVFLTDQKYQQKKCLKTYAMFWNVFLSSCFFCVRFLVFELWAILCRYCHHRRSQEGGWGGNRPCPPNRKVRVPNYKLAPTPYSRYIQFFFFEYTYVRKAAQYVLTAPRGLGEEKE